ncbi:MAG: ABC-2 family transporter protein [Gammaproteobacteria bacterium]|nr:ABC-2 family transporter protein [Gammaproteobacteria bacterium]MDE0191884.1 ABC-2 family transporter protein [Gammaproteobacteria bacterium]
MNAAVLLARYLSISLRGQLQYRMSFLMETLGNFLNSAIELAGIWVLFDRFGDLAGWSFAEVAFFYGTVNCTFATAELLTTGFDHFGTLYVKTGDFDRLLLRPRSTVLQLTGHELSLRRIGRLLPGLVVVIAAWAALDLPLEPARVVLLSFALAGGVAFFFALMMLQATMCFWTTESLELMNVLTHGGVETASYPLPIFHRVFRRFFTYVIPLACVGYFPVVAVLGVDDPLGTSRLFQVSAPLAGFAFLGVAFGVWRIGVRRYTSTGS